MSNIGLHQDILKYTEDFNLNFIIYIIIGGKKKDNA